MLEIAEQSVAESDRCDSSDSQIALDFYPKSKNGFNTTRHTTVDNLIDLMNVAHPVDTDEKVIVEE